VEVFDPASTRVRRMGSLATELSFMTSKRTEYRSQSQTVLLLLSVLSFATNHVSISWPCLRFNFYMRIPCRGYALLTNTSLAMDYSGTIFIDFTEESIFSLILYIVNGHSVVYVVVVTCTSEST
jgi:hypothetical protein